MAEQIERGKLNKYNTQRLCKNLKKAHNRKKRREAKNINNPNPLYNRYNGWAT